MQIDKTRAKPTNWPAGLFPNGQACVLGVSSSTAVCNPACSTDWEHFYTAYKQTFQVTHILRQRQESGSTDGSDPSELF